MNNTNDNNLNEKNSKKKVFRVISIICIVVAIACIAYMIWKAVKERREQEQFRSFDLTTEEASEVVIETETEEDGGIEIPEKVLDWDAMLATNPDIYAWLYVPGTNIDYPILQSGEDKEEDYYLRKNLDGEYSTAGCIYTQKLNGKDFTDYNTVIYGHNMRNGTMFRELHNFEDPTFFDANPYFFIYFPDGSAKAYQIYAAYQFGDEHILYTYNCDTRDNFEAYLSMVKDGGYEGNYRPEIEVTADDTIVTLSTCMDDNSYRWLVQGVLAH